MHNQEHRKPRQHPEHTRIRDLSVEILPHTASQKYLGRKITFHQQPETEVANRLAAGWRKFFLFKRELTSRSYLLNGRLRLFHGTVTPTVLYGSSSWTLTTELQNIIRRTQRQMLRIILGSPHRKQAHIQQEQQQPLPQVPHPPTPPDQHQPPLSPPKSPNDPHLDRCSDGGSGSVSDASDVSSEPPGLDIPQDDDETSEVESWVDWIQRCTHEAEGHMSRLRINDWVSTQHHRKCNWARRVEQDKHKWSYKALQWDPQIHARGYPQRRHARPKTRWTDDLQPRTHSTTSTTDAATASNQINTLAP